MTSSETFGLKCEVCGQMGGMIYLTEWEVRYGKAVSFDVYGCSKCLEDDDGK